MVGLAWWFRPDNKFMRILNEKAIKKIYIRILKGKHQVKIISGVWVLISPTGTKYYHQGEDSFTNWLGHSV